jgi:hypothetical protein
MDPVGMDKPVGDDTPVLAAMDDLIRIERELIEENAVVEGIDGDGTRDDDDG